MDVVSSSSSNYFIEDKRINDLSVLMFNSITCFSFQLNSNILFILPIKEVHRRIYERGHSGSFGKSQSCQTTSDISTQGPLTIPNRHFHRHPLISTSHFYLLPTLQTQWNSSKISLTGEAKSEQLGWDIWEKDSSTSEILYEHKGGWKKRINTPWALPNVF